MNKHGGEKRRQKVKKDNPKCCIKISPLGRFLRRRKGRGRVREREELRKRGKNHEIVDENVKKITFSEVWRGNVV